MIKNGPISEQLKLQEQEIQFSERKTEIDQDSNQDNLFSSNLENKKAKNQVLNTKANVIVKYESKSSINPSSNKGYNQISGLIVSSTSFEEDFSTNYKKQIPKPRKKKRGRKLYFFYKDRCIKNFKTVILQSNDNIGIINYKKLLEISFFRYFCSISI